MVSPLPNMRRRKPPRYRLKQPADIREGVVNAYTVITEVILITWIVIQRLYHLLIAITEVISLMMNVYTLSNLTLTALLTCKTGKHKPNQVPKYSHCQYFHNWKTESD